MARKFKHRIHRSDIFNVALTMAVAAGAAGVEATTPDSTVVKAVQALGKVTGVSDLGNYIIGAWNEGSAMIERATDAYMDDNEQRVIDACIRQTLQTQYPQEVKDNKGKMQPGPHAHVYPDTFVPDNLETSYVIEETGRDEEGTLTISFSKKNDGNILALNVFKEKQIAQATLANADITNPKKVTLRRNDPEHEPDPNARDYMRAGAALAGIARCMQHPPKLQEPS